jgi:hypothetical protein
MCPRRQPVASKRASSAAAMAGIGVCLFMVFPFLVVDDLFCVAYLATIFIVWLPVSVSTVA